MEYIIMIVSHILKSAEFFIIEGLPNISLDNLPEMVEALIFNFFKLAEIYLSGFT